MQWSSDLRTALQQFLRVTRPGGSVLFSTLLDGSLQEVHQAWAQIDGRRHANRFLSGDAFARRPRACRCAARRRSSRCTSPAR